MKKIIVWFRKDLRLHDQPALWEATQQGMVIPVFIRSKEEIESQTSDASLWWLHHSLLSFQKNRFPLIIRVGNTENVLQELINETDADAVFFNEDPNPSIQADDHEIMIPLKAQNIEIRQFNGHNLFSPNDVLNQKQEPYKVFTSFWKRSMQAQAHLPVPAPHSLTLYTSPIKSLEVDELNLLSFVPWHDKLLSHWDPGEMGALNKWEQFLHRGISDYEKKRDFPFEEGTSMLSPYLASGDISIRSIYHTLKDLDNPASSFTRQLIWKEFAQHQLIHFPSFPSKPLRANFEKFPWINDDEGFTRWTKGQTGYPLVDAGMRELWETGCMHNRVRMVAASFLVKHLLIDWRKGSDWFKQTLVDFDLANNAMGWQWITGSGIDSSPFFRIFNPIIQSEKFDPDGDYIKKWIPELSDVKAAFIHQPWKAPNAMYPAPIVDHASARLRALEAYKIIK